MDVTISRLEINDTKIRLVFWKTVNPLGCYHFMPDIYENVNGAIISFNLSQRETFDKVDSYVKEI